MVISLTGAIRRFAYNAKNSKRTIAVAFAQKRY